MACCISAVRAASYHKIKVIILDTGIDVNDDRINANLCKNTHLDFTDEGLLDKVGHGTRVVGLIEKYARDADYCITMLKYSTLHYDPMYAYINALKEAVVRKPDIVNLSLTGEGFNEEERQLICNNPKITFVVSSGNESLNLDQKSRYPAAYDCSNIKVVGSNTVTGEVSKFSNKGHKVQYYEDGENILAPDLHGEYKISDGTSFATAIHTGKLVYEKYIEELRSSDSHQ